MNVLIEDIGDLIRIENDDPPDYLSKIPFNGIYTFAALGRSALYAYNTWGFAKYRIANRKQRSDNSASQSEVFADLLYAISKISKDLYPSLSKPCRIFYEYCLNNLNTKSNIFDGTIARCCYCGTPDRLRRVEGSWICRDHLSERKCIICGRHFPTQWFPPSIKNELSRIHYGCEYHLYIHFPEQPLITSKELKRCPYCDKDKSISNFKIGSFNICKKCHRIYERNRVNWVKIEKDKNLSHTTKTCQRCDIKKPLNTFSKNNKYYDGVEIFCKECMSTITQEDIFDISVDTMTYEKFIQEHTQEVGCTREHAIKVVAKMNVTEENFNEIWSRKQQRDKKRRKV